MERIQDCTNNIMQKMDICTGNKGNSTFYRIRIFERPGRYDAAVSLPIIRGGVNPRLRTSSSKSKDECLTKLLEKIKNTLIQGIDEKFVTADMLFPIFDNISISIQNLKLGTNTILTYFHNIVSCIYGYLNTNTIAPVSPLVTNSVTGNKINNTDIYISNVNNQIQPAEALQEVLTFKDVAIKWFQYKYSYTNKTKDNPNPLSRKTLQGYNKIINLNLIPYFKNYECIDYISNKQFQECIDNTNGYRQKECVFIVLKVILDFARDNNYISYQRTLIKPEKPKKKSKLKIEGHELIYIKSSRQNYWLDCLEKENTDVALLFEGMLLEGFRPEEACGLTWNSLIEDNTFFFVSDAFKDFPVYNEFAEVIGHTREYDELKTDESYRRIPVHPRYQKILMEHKEFQKKEFKRLHLKWSENTPIFLNRYHRPYVAENLSKALKNFRDKYQLEYLTPYGFRHSFATYLSEQGVRDVVLMRLMGHTDFKTTQQYYIFVSDERKKHEYEIAWGICQDDENDAVNTANNISPNIDNNILQKLEELQKMWLQTLAASVLLQKNNA